MALLLLDGRANVGFGLDCVTGYSQIFSPSAWRAYGEFKPHDNYTLPANTSITISIDNDTSTSSSETGKSFDIGLLLRDLWSDIFLGQIIAALVVVLFLAVFLLREWIVQNARPGVFEDGGEEPGEDILAQAPLGPPPPIEPPVQQGAHALRELDVAGLRERDEVVRVQARLNRRAGDQLPVVRLPRRFVPAGDDAVDVDDGHALAAPAPTPAPIDIAIAAPDVAIQPPQLTRKLTGPDDMLPVQESKRRRAFTDDEAEMASDQRDRVFRGFQAQNETFGHPLFPPNTENIQVEDNTSGKGKGVEIAQNSATASSSSVNVSPGFQFTFNPTPAENAKRPVTTPSLSSSSRATSSHSIEIVDRPPVTSSFTFQVPDVPSTPQTQVESLFRRPVPVKPWNDRIGVPIDNEASAPEPTPSESDNSSASVAPSLSSQQEEPHPSAFSKGQKPTMTGRLPVYDPVFQPLASPSLASGSSSGQLRRPPLPPTTPIDELPPPSPRPSHARASPLPSSSLSAQGEAGPSRSPLRDATTVPTPDQGLAIYRAPEELETPSGYFSASDTDAPHFGPRFEDDMDIVVDDLSEDGDLNADADDWVDEDSDDEHPPLLEDVPDALLAEGQAGAGAGGGIAEDEGAENAVDMEGVDDDMDGALEGTSASHFILT